MFDERKFKACVIFQGRTMVEIAEVLHINVATLHRKIRRGGDFTRAEIERLCEFLGIDDPRQIFFKKM